MSDDTYNGWSNYETRNVNLWLSNEEAYYRDIQRLSAPYLPQDADLFADDIRQYVEEHWSYVFEGEPTPGSFGDLKASEGDSLDAVDWEEIAAAWLED